MWDSIEEPLEPDYLGTQITHFVLMSVPSLGQNKKTHFHFSNDMMSTRISPAIACLNKLASTHEKRRIFAKKP